MKTALKFVGLLALAAGTASADVTAETALNSGVNYVYDIRTGATTVGTLDGSRTDYTAYDNSTTAVAAGFSSTDLASQWGDTLNLGGGWTPYKGVVQDNVMSIFNSGSSAGALLTATIGVDFYRASNGSFIGGYVSGAVSFGTGLAPGFFTTVSITGIEGLGIDLDEGSVYMIQRIVTKTGTASRMGVVIAGNPTVGTSPNTMYISSTTVGAPGFYTVSSGGVPTSGNPLYKVVLPAPGAAALLGLGGLMATRRRR